MARCSLRVLFHFEAACIPYEIIAILAITQQDHTRICTVVAYGQALLVMVLNGLAAMVSVNFFLVLVCKTHRRMDRILSAIVWAAAICAATPSLVLGHFGRDPVQGVCWVSILPDRSELRLRVEIGACLFLCLLATWVSLLSCSAVVARLRSQSAIQITLGPQISQSSVQRFRKITIRIMLYPIVSMLLNGFVIATVLLAEKRKVPFTLAMISQMSLNAPGLVFAIILVSLDPDYAMALRQIMSRQGCHQHWDALSRSSCLELRLNAGDTMACTPSPHQDTDESMVTNSQDGTIHAMEHRC